jgi:hypothetical protein
MKPKWMNDPRIRNIPPEKLAVMTLLMEQAEQKTPEEFLPILIKTSQALESAGMSFNHDEKNLLMEVLTKDMSPAERQKLTLIQSLINHS